MNLNKSIRNAMEFSRRVFGRLETHWRGDDKGMDRLGYSREEEEAIQIVTGDEEVKALGLDHYADLAGNHYLIYRSGNPENGVIMTGSHLDAVPNGGRYDGPSGVMAALSTVKILKEEGLVPKHDICVPIWRCEEGPAFRRATLGSGFAAGELSEEIFSRAQAHTGQTLEAYMKALGLNVDALKNAVRNRYSLIPLRSVVCALEQHIEQSTTLHSLDADVGIVTGLRGYVNYPDRITFHGVPNHTGTQPQKDRRDPVRVGSEFVTEASRRLEILGDEYDLTFVFPVASSGQEASTCRSAAVYKIAAEARSLDPEVLRQAHRLIYDAAKDTAENFNMDVTVGDASFLNPVPMSPDMVRDVRTAAWSLGVSFADTVSGAVHDTGTLMRHGVPSTMLLTRHGEKNGGQSHWPGEDMVRREGDDPFAVDSPFANAVRVMTHFAATAQFQNSGKNDFARQLLEGHCGIRVEI